MRQKENSAQTFWKHIYQLPHFVCRLRAIKFTARALANQKKCPIQRKAVEERNKEKPPGTLSCSMIARWNDHQAKQHWAIMNLSSPLSDCQMLTVEKRKWNLTADTFSIQYKTFFSVVHVEYRLLSKKFYCFISFYWRRDVVCVQSNLFKWHGHRNEKSEKRRKKSIGTIAIQFTGWQRKKEGK